MDTNQAKSITEVDPVAYVLDKLRDRLRPHESISIINEVEEIIREKWVGLGKNQIDALKLLVDIQFRKLAKVLPDLKVVDGAVGETASKVNFIINVESPSAPKETKIL